MSDVDRLALAAQAFVDRKYVARADERQKVMGLAYIEAERQDLAREIVRFCQQEALRADRERMWCQACGTVTRDGICDCNRYSVGHEMRREPNFVNYADQLQKDARELAVELERIRADPVRSAAQPMREALELARSWIDPHGDPIADSSREVLAVINAALTPASANERKDEAGAHHRNSQGGASHE